MNVLHGVVDNVELGQLLVDGGAGHMLLQGLEGLVDGLDPVPLPGVPLDGLEVLLGLDCVAVHRVVGNQFTTRGHDPVYLSRF